MKQRSLRHFCHVLVLLAVAACKPPVALGPVPVDIQTDVSFIGDVRQEGRAVGSAGSRRAATYIVQRYQDIQIRGLFQNRCPAEPACENAYYQPFNAPNARNARNIAVMIAGSDSTKRDEYVIIGGHYDHIGRSSTMSLDPEKEDAIRPGADDNASGTAAVMELARRLAIKPTRRSVILVHFDAEEEGLFGSRAFTDMMPVLRNKVVFMLNLDMVGRLRDGGLQVDKTTLMYDDPPLLALLDSVTTANGIKHSYTKSIDARSDHANFRRADISSMAFFTGFHGDYHRATDVVWRLDLRGIGQVADVAEAIVRFSADRK